MHLLHKWQAIDKRLEHIENYFDDYLQIKNYIITYRCSVCGKTKAARYKEYLEIVRESKTENGNGFKTKEFSLWRSNDSNISYSRDRIKLVMDAALKWINDNNINVINISEDCYCGGRWTEEERGSTVKVYYK